MIKKKPRIADRFQQILKKIYKRRSLFLLVLLFLLSIIFPLFIAQVSVSTTIVQNQYNNTRQLVEQGKKLYQAAQFEKAAAVWQQAVEAFSAQKDRLNQAMALSNLSLTYQQLGQWNEAKSAIAQSFSLLETEKGTEVLQSILAATLDIEGQLQLSLGQPNNALNSWQEASKIYQKIGDNNRVIQSQINQAQAMQELGFYPRACRTLLEALEIDSQECRVLEEQLQVLPENVPISLQILGLRSLGNVLRVTGKPLQAQIVLLKSWQLAQTREDSQNLAAIALSLGNTFQVLGNQKISREQKQPSILTTESLACNPTKNYETSTEFYQQAIACYRQAESESTSFTKIQAQLNLLSLFIKIQQWSKIPSLIEKIQSQLIPDSNNNPVRDLPTIKIPFLIPPNPPSKGGNFALNDITSLPSNRKKVFAQLKLAQNLMCLEFQLRGDKTQLVSPILQSCPAVQQRFKPINEKELQQLQIPSWQTINQLVESALNQAHTLGDKQAEANALGYLGASYQLRGKPATAQQLTEQALQRLSAFDNPELVYLWQWQLGRLQQLQGQNDQAIASYTLAVDILESLRQDLVITSADIQFNFRDSVEPVYRELVDILLQPSINQQGKMGEISEDNLKKARDIIESLQLAELNNFFREACIDAKPQQIEQFDSQGAVIYSIVLPKRLALVLSIPGKPLSYYETAVNKNLDNSVSEEIEQVFDDMFANLNPYFFSEKPLYPHQQFYDWLIRPLETELEENNIKTLVFVLDGVLSGVPMAALHDGKQYLIEKYNIALTPGLQLLSPRSLSSEQLRTLAGGVAEARQGFSPLPGVKQEVKEITELVSTEVLLDQDFTRDRLQREIESTSFPIIHLATHGQFSSQAEDTFLLTWDERINVKNLDQLLQEREGQEQNPIELLILSACQTAAGDKRAVLGLAGVAVRSGARSTLATLWSVQDRSTSYFILKFYETLSQPNVSKAEALRQAQLSLLRSSQYQHPFYWAPFVLVGNWL